MTKQEIIEAIKALAAVLQANHDANGMLPNDTVKAANDKIKELISML